MRWLEKLFLVGIAIELPIVCAAPALCVLLMGCATTPPTTPACLPLKPYTAAEQQALAAALAALPDGSPLLRPILDYEAMRDADRACLAAVK